MFALLRFFLALFSSLFKSKSRLEAENAALRRQLIVLQRKVRGRVHFTNSDRLFLIQLYRCSIGPQAPGLGCRHHKSHCRVGCLISEAFPWNEAPRYLIRDRDRVYGTMVTRRVRAMGIRDKPIAGGSPWQNCFAERLIGSIRRECLDHFVILGEAHLRRILGAYAAYYNVSRTHRSLDKDTPFSRPVQRAGSIHSHAILGGLHHHYVRV